MGRIRMLYHRLRGRTQSMCPACNGIVDYPPGTQIECGITQEDVETTRSTEGYPGVETLHE